jgi:hypothetical protein
MDRSISPYFKPEDIPEEGMVVTIDDIYSEKLKSKNTGLWEDKPVLKFVGQQKGLWVNLTNRKRLEREFGDDAEGWLGQQIKLVPGLYGSTPTIYMEPV